MIVTRLDSGRFSAQPEVRLVGQLSNPSSPLMRVLDAFRQGVPESGVQRKANLVGKRLGNGVVARAIGEILADGQPKKLAEIRGSGGDRR